MSEYNYDSYERETIINFNEAEQTAEVYTWNKALISKLMKLNNTRDDITQQNGDTKCATFIVPKKWIKVSPPRQVSEENKAKASERFQKMWADKKNN